MNNQHPFHGMERVYIPPMVAAHDFSSSLPIELKELPSKFNELTGEVKAFKTQVHGLEIEVLSLLLKVTQALNMFTKVLHLATLKAGDQSVPSAGQASTMPAEGEKKTNQATIS
ncbi:hypothetical protein Tco_0150364 [Tanacetum coccineum]